MCPGVSEVVVQEDSAKLDSLSEGRGIGAAGGGIMKECRENLPKIVYDTIVTFLYNSILEDQSNPLMYDKLKVVNETPAHVMIWLYDVFGTQAIENRKVLEQHASRKEPSIVSVYREHHFPTGLGMIKDRDVVLPITDKSFQMQMLFWQICFCIRGPLGLAPMSLGWP